MQMLHTHGYCWKQQQSCRQINRKANTENNHNHNQKTDREPEIGMQQEDEENKHP